MDLAAGFELWSAGGGHDPKLLADFLTISHDALSAFVAGGSKRKLYVAMTVWACDDPKLAADWFATAFRDCPDLQRSDEGAWLDCAAEGMGSSLAAIMASKNPEDGILSVLVQMQADSELASARYEELLAHQARKALEPLPCTIEQAAQYCRAKGADAVIHQALFWAVAGWAVWKKTALVSVMPNHGPEGPHFLLLDPTEQPAITDPEVRQVLDAAIAHVLGAGAGAEPTQREPLWIVTPDTQPMAQLVDIYSAFDATGAIHHIFPWMF